MHNKLLYIIMIFVIIMHALDMNHITIYPITNKYYYNKCRVCPYRKKKTFNYYINSLKFTRLDEKKKLANKKYAKEYVIANFKEINVLSNLFVIKNPQDIFNVNINEKIIIKSTIGTGRNKIVNKINCKNHSKLFKIIKKWNSERHWSTTKLLKHTQLYEPQYDTDPNDNEILIEKFIEKLDEYSFHMVNGNILFIQTDRGGRMNRSTSLYDINWKLLKISCGDRKPAKGIHKPKSFNKMIKFCKDFYNKTKLEYVRIDMYDIHGKIYFGEFTFTPYACSCYMSDNYDEKIYNKIQQSNKV
mgnify:CR=1 FL=1|jgi:hypothetical protein